MSVHSRPAQRPATSGWRPAILFAVLLLPSQVLLAKSLQIPAPGLFDNISLCSRSDTTGSLRDAVWVHSSGSDLGTLHLPAGIASFLDQFASPTSLGALPAGDRPLPPLRAEPGGLLQPAPIEWRDLKTRLPASLR